MDCKQIRQEKREARRLHRDRVRADMRQRREEKRKSRHAYRRARRKSMAGRGLDIHVTAWLSTSFFLFVVNLLTGIGTPWFLYPTLAWFIGIACHAAAVGRIRPTIRKFFSMLKGRGWFDPFGDEPPSNKYAKQPLHSERLADDPTPTAMTVDVDMVDEKENAVLTNQAGLR